MTPGGRARGPEGRAGCGRGRSENGRSRRGGRLQPHQAHSSPEPSTAGPHPTDWPPQGAVATCVSPAHLQARPGIHFWKRFTGMHVAGHVGGCPPLGGRGSQARWPREQGGWPGSPHTRRHTQDRGSDLAPRGHVSRVRDRSPSCPSVAHHWLGTVSLRCRNTSQKGPGWWWGGGFPRDQHSRPMNRLLLTPPQKAGRRAEAG